VTEHFTKNTVEAKLWCRKCSKFTMHRIDRDRDQGRKGPCLDCIARGELQIRQRKKREDPPEQTEFAWR
jgi:hypothetical protein